MVFLDGMLKNGKKVFFDFNMYYQLIKYNEFSMGFSFNLINCCNVPLKFILITVQYELIIKIITNYN